LDARETRTATTVPPSTAPSAGYSPTTATAGSTRSVTLRDQSAPPLVDTLTSTRPVDHRWPGRAGSAHDTLVAPAAATTPGRSSVDDEATAVVAAAAADAPRECRQFRRTGAGVAAAGCAAYAIADAECHVSRHSVAAPGSKPRPLTTRADVAGST